MSETYTTCPICGRRIDRDAPDAVHVEKLHDLPGSGQLHDPVLSLAGFAHERCLARARDYRAVVD